MPSEKLIEPRLYRFPALDPETFRRALDDLLGQAL